jgi:hypothetical protein
MKLLVLSLAFLWLPAVSEAQTLVSLGGVKGDAQANSIFQSIENGDMQSVGGHYILTRKDSHTPISMTFKSSLGVGFIVNSAKLGYCR